jgi:hypothetical protein
MIESPLTLSLLLTGALSVDQPYKYAVYNSTVGKWYIDSGSVARVIQDTVGGNFKISNDAMYFFIPSSDVCTRHICHLY